MEDKPNGWIAIQGLSGKLGVEITMTCDDMKSTYHISRRHLRSDRMTDPTLAELQKSIPIIALIDGCETSKEVADKISVYAKKAGARMLKPKILKLKNRFEIVIRGDDALTRLSCAIAQDYN